MKIKRVECDQFAGICDKEWELEDGMNVILGKNESGKSTMVELIYQVLFQDVKVDGRSSRDFTGKYFPQKTDGPQGDVIDGKVVFETSGGRYALTKEWEWIKGKKVEGSGKLKMPDGTLLKDMETIDKTLLEELHYNSGVFREIVFATQKRNSAAIETILGNGKEKKEIRDSLKATLTQAALETGGVSLEKLEEAILNKMKELGGRWDVAADAPEGGAKRASYKNAWAGGAGSIVKKYYEVDAVRSKQEEAKETEEAVEAQNEQLKRLRAEKKAVEEEKAEFQKLRGTIGQAALLSKQLLNLEERIREQEKAAEEWPQIQEDIRKARRLRKLREQAAVHACYQKAREFRTEYEEALDKLHACTQVDPEDIRRLRRITSQKREEEQKFAGMNMLARIQQPGREAIRITSLATGEELAFEDGNIQISEAVDISIPGVLKMQLLPDGMDADRARENICKWKEELDALHQKYGIDSVDALQELSDTYIKQEQIVWQCRQEFDQVLGDKSWEELQKAKEAVPQDIADAEELDREIMAVCGTKTVDAFLGGKEAALNSYMEKYHTLEQLQETLRQDRMESRKVQEKLERVDDIPDKFRNIEDEEEYEYALEQQQKAYEARIEQQEEKRQEAERKLGERTAEEYTEELRQLEEELAARKKEYRHWCHIYDVYCRQREQISGDPVADIEDRFREYLSVVTDGSVRVTSMDESLEDVQLSSDSHRLSYAILSEGTKDTIALAFRLAMLEHLYPQGEGIAVFDDPFTDMDADRTEKACRLLQKYAEHNQVIFITCDDRYAKLLHGNIISGCH